MTAAVSESGLPVTGEEYPAAGETPRRTGLSDGSLFATPAPAPGHRHVAAELRLTEPLEAALDPGDLPPPG